MVRVAVTKHPTAEWSARQITEAFPWNTAPAILIRDNDKAFGLAFRRRIRAMGIRDHWIAPKSPWQNGYVERAIGSVRRECLDHLIVFNAVHLQRVLDAYVAYFNSVRTHHALDKDAPIHRTENTTGSVRPRAILGGLHHHYVRV
jgi:transposase InsO family protein